MCNIASHPNGDGRKMDAKKKWPVKLIQLHFRIRMCTDFLFQPLRDYELTCILPPCAM